MADEGKYAGGELARMIQALVDASVSEHEMARRAERAGFPISNSQLNKYRRGIVTKAPDGEQLRALAAALGEDERIVRRAVIIDWFGYDPADIAGMPMRSRFPDRVDVLLEALGERLASLPESVQRERVSEIMRRYVLNGG